MIKSLVNKFGGKNASLPDLRFLLTYLLGFSGFLRIEELLLIKTSHIWKFWYQNQKPTNIEKDMLSTFLEFHQNVVQ